VVDVFQGAHTREELVLVQHTLGDLYWGPRASYYGITYMPTVCGNGVSDVWPVSWLEDDYQAHAAEPSPLTISLAENGIGDFTAHLEAEVDISDARFCMVATLDEYVQAHGGGLSHLPYHAVAFMTSATGDPLNMSVGEKLDIQKSFTLDPSWDYGKMGVACWVQQAGGTNPSPQPYGDVPVKNKVMQAAWLGSLSGDVPQGGLETAVSLSAPTPNPFVSSSTLAFFVPARCEVKLVVYSAAGREVRVLADDVFGPGTHELRWEGLDDGGEECAPGVYFARLSSDSFGADGTKVVKLR